MWDVFLSYSHANKDLARWLLGDLEKAGLNVWWDDYYVESFDNHVQRVSEGISESRAFMALLTEEYVDSLYAPVEMEVAAMTLFAIKQKNPAFKRSILFAVADFPLLLSDSCLGLLDLGEQPPHADLLRIDDNCSWKSWTFSFQLEIAWRMSRVLHTPDFGALEKAPVFALQKGPTPRTGFSKRLLWSASSTPQACRGWWKFMWTSEGFGAI